MDDLINWVKIQKTGIATFHEFQRRALSLRATEPRHAALLRLLADMSGRFADAYDDQPLPADVAATTLGYLKHYLEKAVLAQNVDPKQYLALLNEVGNIELD